MGLASIKPRLLPRYLKVFLDLYIAIKFIFAHHIGHEIAVRQYCVLRRTGKIRNTKSKNS